MTTALVTVRFFLKKNFFLIFTLRFLDCEAEFSTLAECVNRTLPASNFRYRWIFFMERCLLFVVFFCFENCIENLFCFEFFQNVVHPPPHENEVNIFSILVCLELDNMMTGQNVWAICLPLALHNRSHNFTIFFVSLDEQIHEIAGDFDADIYTDNIVLFFFYVNNKFIYFCFFHNERTRFIWNFLF